MKKCKIPILFLMSLAIMTVSSCEIPKGSESNMPITYIVESINSLTINTGHNAPFDYTNGTIETNFKYLTIQVKYHDELNPATVALKTFINYGITGDTFPSGSFLSAVVVETGKEYFTRVNSAEPINLTAEITEFTIGADVYSAGTASKVFNANIEEDRVTSIDIYEPPTITSYEIGDTLDLSGLTISAHFVSGNSDFLDVGYTTSPSSGYRFRASDIGNKVITVIYQSNSDPVTDTFSLTITSHVSAIQLVTAPTSNQYYGSYLSTTGMVVKKYWSDGLTSETTTSFTTNFDSTYFENVGNVDSVIITYTGNDTVFTLPTVSFIPTVLKPSLSSLTISTNKTSYNVGEVLLLSDINLVATYGGTYADYVESSITAFDKINDIDEINLDDFVITDDYKFTALNSALVLTVIWNNIEATCTLSIEGFNKLIIDTMGQTNFKQNATFSHTSVKVYAVGTNDYTELVTSDCTFSSPTMSTAGTKTVTVTYTNADYDADITGSYSILVYGALDSITAVDSDTNYNKGEMYNTNTLVVTANYIGGYSVVVLGYTTNPMNNTVLNTLGTIAVTVSFTDTLTKTVSYNLTVIEYSDGKLYYYDDDGNELVFGYPNEPYNMCFNLDDTPSNAKLIVSNNIRLALPKGTIVYQKDTDSWWIVNKDSSQFENGIAMFNATKNYGVGEIVRYLSSDLMETYACTSLPTANTFPIPTNATYWTIIDMQDNAYVHTLELKEAFEKFNGVALPDCAFYQRRYTLSTMLARLSNIAKTTFTVIKSFEIDWTKQNYFFSFEGLTLATAIKQIASSIKAIPKVKYQVVDGVLSNPYLYFILKQGISNVPIDISLLSVAYELNQTSDKFATRVVSKVKNCQSSELCVYPKGIGIPLVSETELLPTADTVKLILPSNISKVEYVDVCPMTVASAIISGGSVLTSYTGYYYNALDFYNKFIATLELQGAISDADKLKVFNGLYSNRVVNRNDKDITGRKNIIPSTKGSLLKPKEYYDLVDDVTIKASTMYWEQEKNEINGFNNFIKTKTAEIASWGTLGYLLLGATGSPSVNTTIDIGNYHCYITFKHPDTYLAGTKFFLGYRFRIGYYPMANVTITKDNKNVGQYTELYNQNGKVVDVYAVSKLIDTYANDCSGTNRIRRNVYTTYGNIYPIGTLVKDGSVLLVIKQVSIDYRKGYFEAEYNLSDSIAVSSDFISADNSIINYDVPMKASVTRTQVYKDYIEFSLSSSDNHNDTPYLPINLSLANIGSSTLKGTKLDYACFVKSSYDNSATTKYYTIGCVEYSIDKGKLLFADFQDNNIVGIQINHTNVAGLQTPFSYVNQYGEFDEITLVFSKDIKDYAGIESPLERYPEITQAYYDKVITEHDWDIGITETNYDKDGFEIPAFEYSLEVGEVNNFVFASDFFDFDESINGDNYDFFMVISDKYVNDNNASLLSGSLSNYLSIATDLTSATPTITLTVIGTATQLLGKNIAIFKRYSSVAGQPIFLFGINDFPISATSTIVIHINNYRIYGI